MITYLDKLIALREESKDVEHGSQSLNRWFYVYSLLCRNIREDQVEIVRNELWLS